MYDIVEQKEEGKKRKIEDICESQYVICGNFVNRMTEVGINESVYTVS